MAMKTLFAHMTAATALAIGASGCYVYDPYYPYPYHANATASTFDRSWNAMLGAFSDQGVNVVAQDRANGFIDGRRGDISVRAHIAPQNDGTVRAEFNVNGAAQDPGLPDRISRAYDARMGR
jgi:hypothetical protein